MNSQQAINLLNGLEQRLDDYCELNNEGKAAFRMAITALELFGNAEQLPSAQPVAKDINVPAKDCISRQWLMECVDDGWIKFDTQEDENRFVHLIRDIAPSAQSTMGQVNQGDTVNERAVKFLDLFAKTYCRDKSVTDDLKFRCSDCEFEMPDKKCLVKCMARKLFPDYKNFGSMGDL